MSIAKETSTEARLAPGIDQLNSTHSWTGVQRVHNVVKLGLSHNNGSFSVPIIYIRVPESYSSFHACFKMRSFVFYYNYDLLKSM